MRAICKGICDAYGAECTVEYTHEFASTVNWKSGVEVIAAAASRVLGEENVDAEAEPNSGSEDFGLFLEHVPGAFAFYGTGKGPDEEFIPLHNPRYDYNDAYLETAANLYAAIAKESLSHK